MENGAGGRILLVDDDEAFRTFVRELLERVGYETAQVASGGAVLTAVSAERPAAVLLDVHLPDLNGYEICRELRDRYGSAIAIVFVSGERTDALDRSGGLLLGADDYLIKPVDPGELLARIRRLLDHRPAERRTVTPNARLQSLTRREREVLDLLAEGRTQKTIANELVISPRTVATHIQRILTKLEVRSRAQAVALVLRDARDVSGHALLDQADVLV